MRRALVVLDVAPIVQQLGIRVTKERGDEIHAACPRHIERLGKPDRSADSWSVNRKSGVHGCWSCGYAGTLATLVCDTLDIDYWSALDWLTDAGWKHIEIRETLADPEDEPLRNIVVRSIADEWDTFTFPPAKALAARNITEQAARDHDLRWGTYNGRNGWAIPIKTAAHHLLGFQHKSKSGVLNVPEGIEKAEQLFGLDVFQIGEEAIIVESPLDVVRLSSVGVRRGLSSFGVHVSDAQIALALWAIGRDGNVMLALDWDAEGRLGTRTLYDRIRQRVPEARFFNYRAVKATENHLKDIGDMTDAQILRGINKSVVIEGAELRKLLPPTPVAKPEFKRQRQRVQRVSSGRGLPGAV